MQWWQVLDLNGSEVGWAVALGRGSCREQERAGKQLDVR